MNTAPEKQNANDKSEPVSRLRRMQDRGEAPSLPENPAPHLIDWFLEIGPTVSAGMVEAPIGWPDMAAWQGLTGIELDPWEARTIRRMSSAFISQRQDAKKPGCPPPWSPDLPKETRDKVSSQFAAMMSGFGVKGR